MLAELRDDYARYPNAERLFRSCRRGSSEVKAARAQLDASRDMIRAVRYDAMGSAPGGHSDPVAQSAERLMAVERRCAAAISRVGELHQMALDAIDEMERAGDAADGDAAVLRMYYLAGKSNGETASALGYSPGYIANKKAVAMMHVAPFVPLDWEHRI